MNIKPILSICIPTFNRLHYLKELLENLAPQISNNNVEVCVSDNCSNDGTAEFLIDISSSFPTLRYVINSINIGLDNNMLSVISMANGQYIYPIGDDDIIPLNSLASILIELKKRCDVLILNGWHTDYLLVKNRVHLAESIAGYSFTKAENAFVALWDKMPFGSFLASRDCFLKEYSHRFIGTSHAYTGAIWDALADIEKARGFCNVKCMKLPTVLLRGGEKSWRKDAALIMLYEIPHWFSLLTEKDAYKGVAPAIRSDFLKNQTKINSLLYLRVIGQLNKVDITTLGRECTPQQVQKLRIVAMLPLAAAQFIVDVLAKLRVVAKAILVK